MSLASPRGALRRIDGFVFAPEDPRRLAAMRIGLFGLLAFRIATGDYTEAAERPTELFDPISLFVLLSQMPPKGVVIAVQVAGVAAALSAACGAIPRLSFPVSVASAVFLGLILNAGGKVVHNDVVLILCLLPLLMAPRAASKAWSLGRPTNSPPAAVAYGWPIRTAMLIIGIAYLVVGLQKLRYSGLDWATSDNLRYILYSASDSQATPNAIALFVADRDWLAHILAAGTLLLEIGFILCLPFARLRWLFVPGVISLHLGIWATMDLDYSAQALTVLIVFVNWVALARELRAAGLDGSNLREAPD